MLVPVGMNDLDLVQASLLHLHEDTWAACLVDSSAGIILRNDNNTQA